MLPVITIVGRPNVGKSTLFNVLTKTRDALVADMPGVTRDRQYGEGVVGGRPYIIVDTGGIACFEKGILTQLTEQQVEQAIEEADVLLFVVDAQAGLTPNDEEIAKRLRNFQDKVVLVVNKMDRQDESLASDFFRLGFPQLKMICATQGRGIEAMMADVLARFPSADEEREKHPGIAVAMIGRPNAGKSTLINRILGEERVIVSEIPGTTRDSIYIPFERHGEHYTLIDTAGVRRRARIEEVVEKFSVIKTMQAIERCDVAIVMIDAHAGMSDQDMRLINLVLKIGRALILVFNKWDGLEDSEKNKVKDSIDRDLGFVTFARRYFISALHGSGVGDLFRAIKEAYESAQRELTTPELTKALEKAVNTFQPPAIQGRRIRLRYAHMGGLRPMTIVIHGKQTGDLPDSYQRYLASFFRKEFRLIGIPVHIKLRNDANPYSQED